MPDITPTSGGAWPPKPAEAAKVQPKKETFRINLPPKPTSAPTIKLPTLAPGAPPPTTGAAAPVASPAAPRAAAAPVPPSAGAPASRVAAAPASAVAPRAAAPVPAPRPVVVSGVGLSTVDMVLAIVAMIASLAGLSAVLYLAFFLKDTTGV